MRNTSKTLSCFCFAILVTLLVGVHSSCNDNNKCDFVNCANAGSCNSGVCTCITGYQGPLCATQSTTDFIGSQSVWDSGTLFGPVTYPLDISQGTAVTALVIKNLYYGFFPDTVNAYISGPSTFTIPSQIILGKVVNGQGIFYSSQEVVVSYQVISGGVTDNRIMTWMK